MLPSPTVGSNGLILLEYYSPRFYVLRGFLFKWSMFLMSPRPFVLGSSVFKDPGIASHKVKSVLVHYVTRILCNQASMFTMHQIPRNLCSEVLYFKGPTFQGVLCSPQSTLFQGSDISRALCPDIVFSSGPCAICSKSHLFPRPYASSFLELKLALISEFVQRFYENSFVKRFLW